jgi:ArsR family transcriptional regulator
MPKLVKPRVLSDAALALIAARFKVLSEALRLKILIQLETGEKNVTELMQATGASQANVSRQLHTLSEAGIVARRKAGQKAYYPDLRPERVRPVRTRVRQPAKTFRGAGGDGASLAH